MTEQEKSIAVSAILAASKTNKLSCLQDLKVSILGVTLTLSNDKNEGVKALFADFLKDMEAYEIELTEFKLEFEEKLQAYVESKFDS